MVVDVVMNTLLILDGIEPLLFIPKEILGLAVVLNLLDM